ncbi:hypothetical protein BLOT_011691 [Blomia tropicalis]|nr:hypothetical protein BLOT_011691 [Blomia tropicalis]
MECYFSLCQYQILAPITKKGYDQAQVYVDIRTNQRIDEDNDGKFAFAILTKMKMKMKMKTK